VVEGAGEHLDTIMMTKVMTPADVLFADKLLHQLEKKLKLKRRIGLEALIEEVEGMQNVDAIAKSTPRLECLVFGWATSRLDGRHHKDVGSNDGLSRRPLALCALPAGHGLPRRRHRSVDGPFADFRNARPTARSAGADDPGLRRGKWAIHPAQIDHRWRSTRPKPEDVARAPQSSRRPMPRREAKGLGASISTGHGRRRPIRICATPS